ncbi:tRNA lysidine(34) synthetase TilS [Candidatus Pacearchaeota archaeon]|nr:tRNA lysidine(34) synthetase TilS [Candidatus Pacearchaeota archaeon]|tara:strand:+ start:1660 stop:2352 length:693 start_codon:yes stop_codon:yes gene_type:complete
MIKLLGNIPNRIAVAVSGGPDSMAALSFFQNNGRREVMALYFNHGTEHAAEAEAFVVEYCKTNSVPLVVGNLSREKRKEESREEFWRNERYSFFNDYLWPKDREVKTYQVGYDFLTNFYYSNTPIVTCHHLDDAVETWIFTSLHGNSMLIPYKRDNFIRPLLTTRKDDLIVWCHNKNIPFVIDPSNLNTEYMRNFIRHTLLPNALRVNPGLHKVVKKKLEEAYRKTVDAI